MSEVPIEGKIIEPNRVTAYWVPDLENPEAPTAAELAGATKLEGVEVTGYSLGPVDVDEPTEPFDWKGLVTSFRAIRPYWGQGWQETPREELRRRLNNWLQGTYPGEPINWKGLK